MVHVFSGDPPVLGDEWRRKAIPPESVLSALRIKEGETVIDLGCGIGYFSIPASKMVGKAGKVIAVDISQKMIDEIKKRAEGIENIEIIKSESIRDLKGDVVLLINVLHELDNPKKGLEECFLALKHGGRLGLIDWQKKKTERGPPLSHRISREEAIKMAGRPFIEHEIHSDFYFLEFRKE